jgi:hypothetical protein
MGILHLFGMFPMVQQGCSSFFITKRTHKGDYMSNPLEALMEQIKVSTSRLKQAESDYVLATIDLAKSIKYLKEMCPRSWIKRLKSLGYHPRVAARYLVISRSFWCGPNGLANDVASQLPSDLQSLEALSQLSTEQLHQFLLHIRSKECSRAVVIRTVQAVLNGRTLTPKAPEPITVDDILEGWMKAVEHTLENIEMLGSDVTTPEVRDTLMDELRTKFRQIETALTTSPAEQEPSAEESVPSTLPMVERLSVPSTTPVVHAIAA